MLWHRQAIFESKGDKLSSSAECRIRTQGLRQLFASRLNACWQTDSAIEDQAKTWTRQPIPMISKHSAHSTSLPVGFRTWLWRYTCLLLLISMLWHRQAIFESKGDKLSSSAECRIRTQGLRHLFASRLNACWQTDSAIEDQAKTWTRQPVPMISKHSAHSTSLPVGFRTWHWRYTCLLLLISMLWHRQAIFESKGDELSSPSTCPKLTSHACALLIDNVGNYLYLNNGSFIFEVDPHQFNLRLHHFSQFQRKGRKKKFKSCQICDWLAKWLIGLGFMDLRWPRVYRRSNVGLVNICLGEGLNLEWVLYCLFCFLGGFLGRILED